MGATGVPLIVKRGAPFIDFIFAEVGLLSIRYHHVNDRIIA
jgi:hypothetical protein